MLETAKKNDWINQLILLIADVVLLFFALRNNLGNLNIQYLVVFLGCLTINVFVLNTRLLTLEKDSVPVYISIAVYCFYFFLLAFSCMGISTAVNATIEQLSILFACIMLVISLENLEMKFQKNLIIFFFIFLIGWNIWLVGMLLENPYYARMAIAHELDQISLSFASPYGIAQCSSIVGIALFWILFDNNYHLRKKINVLIVCFEILVMYELYLTQSSITLYVYLFFLAFIVAKKTFNGEKNNNFVFVVSFILIVIFLISIREQIGEIITYLYRNDSTITGLRMRELGLYLSGDNYSEGVFLRLGKIQASINGIKQNALFGTYYTEGVKYGGDNKFLDVMANCGICGGILYFNIIVQFIRFCYKKISHYNAMLWLPFVIYGLLNNLYVTQPYYAVFFIVPMLLSLLNERKHILS